MSDGPNSSGRSSSGPNSSGPNSSGRSSSGRSSKNPAVLLTGGTGFLGARVAARLVRDGCRVTLLTRPGLTRPGLTRPGLTRPGLTRPGASGCASPRALGWAGIADAVTLLPCEAEPQALQRCLAATRPDAVIHLAAVSRGGEDPEAVGRMLAANVLLPTLLLAAMREAGTRLFLNTGTSWQTTADGASYHPFNVYAGTKQACEDLLACFCLDAMQAITLRLFDTYGPGDTRGKIVDLIAAAALRGTPLAMSPGEQVIDLVHVEDAAAAYAVALRLLLDGQVRGHEVFGVSGERLTLRALARRIAEVAGREAPIAWGGRPYRPREVMRPWSGFTPLPGWRPGISLDAGLRELVRAHAASATA